MVKKTSINTPLSGQSQTAVEQFSERLGEQSTVAGRSLWQDARRRFLSNRAAVLSMTTLLVILLLVLFGSSVSQYTFDEIDWSYMAAPPSLETGHYFGTDHLGRDLFVRTLEGGRISFMVGILGALVAVIIGTVYGSIAGYLGGRVDVVMMRMIEIMESFPFMFLVILLVTFFGRSILLIFIAIGAVSWLDMARIVRGQTLSLKRREFVEAAIISGANTRQILFRHLIPNLLGIVVVYASLLVPGMILFESFLSFLGLGVQEPMTSWGALVNEGALTIEVAIWQLMFPTAFLVITLFCFNFIGDGLRDALDPKER
ncbi:peptide ABC transporter permease [Endozoicomonas montiporae]|uniref:Oligopeptide transport system permease protein OppC n=2 Tax=Endozoicomonas montiporae TaxID=1027273 RepID=A0A081N091_9GAMM|nr:oligopeptide ABC transporter permease OppC [Endozoicomonas montiporae]AMO54316.1 oligopeptide ABC transporter permease protein [Endozoicomonas montiporae CL-33]KEQ11864.1 peptide ABC transporter permease [Endozoicomonas montiporae]